MNPRLSCARLLAAAAMMLAAMAANADIRVFTDRAAFNAATTNRGVDNYDDLPFYFIESPLARSAGSYSYFASSTGLFGAGATGDVWLSNVTTDQAILFSGFSGGASAFGGNFFGTDNAGLYLENTNMSLTASASDGSTLTFTINNTATTSFLGFVSDSALTSVSLNSLGEYWPTANNLTLAMAAPVPEPASYAMLLGGVALLGAARRSRR
jgi:hypothetical protein